MGFRSKISGLTSLLYLVGTASAGFDPASQSNLAVYWGQNSAGGQKPLSHYCDNDSIKIIPLAFLKRFSNPMELNFATGGCSKSASGLLHCPDIAKDIKTCQAKGKTIILSFGGDTYDEGGFESAEEAKKGAQRVWATFGPPDGASDAERPFDDAVVDGYDYDFESDVKNMDVFGQELRRLMDEASGTYYLTAAPQCPFPETHYQKALETVPFDFVMVQYYNNPCGVQSFGSGTSNFQKWDNWAKSKKTKVMLGIPAAESAAGSGYTSGEKVADAIGSLKQFESFGGVMMWDMSQLYANEGFLEHVTGALGQASNAQSSGDGNSQGGSQDGQADGSDKPQAELKGAVNHAVVSAQVEDGNDAGDQGDQDGDQEKSNNKDIDNEKKENKNIPEANPLALGGVFKEEEAEEEEEVQDRPDGQQSGDNDAQADEPENKQLEGDATGANGWPTDGSYVPPARSDDGLYDPAKHGVSKSSRMKKRGNVTKRRWSA